MAGWQDLVIDIQHDNWVEWLWVCWLAHEFLAVH
jgi:hypothetical protein